VKVIEQRAYRAIQGRKQRILHQVEVVVVPVPVLVLDLIESEIDERERNARFREAAGKDRLLAHTVIAIATP